LIESPPLGGLFFTLNLSNRNLGKIMPENGKLIALLRVLTGKKRDLLTCPVIKGLSDIISLRLGKEALLMHNFGATFNERA